MWCDVMRYFINTFLHLSVSLLYFLSPLVTSNILLITSSLLTLPPYTCTFSNYAGIVVSIVPRRHRPVSSSLSLVVFNLFGYFLSLVLSGYLMQVRTCVRYMYVMIRTTILTIWWCSRFFLLLAIKYHHILIYFIGSWEELGLWHRMSSHLGFPSRSILVILGFIIHSFSS
jgi:hypothetical protein